MGGRMTWHGRSAATRWTACLSRYGLVMAMVVGNVAAQQLPGAATGAATGAQLADAAQRDGPPQGSAVSARNYSRLPVGGVLGVFRPHEWPMNVVSFVAPKSISPVSSVTTSPLVKVSVFLNRNDITRGRPPEML